MMRVATITAALLLTGCGALVPKDIRAEASHTSHPLLGFPFEPQAGSEDVVNAAQLLAHYEHQRIYVDIGLGVNINGAGGGGMTGDAFLGTIRGGVILWKRDGT